jgi:hypothetical protein
VGRASAELIALVGARVLGEHLHPALVEKITVLEGQLTVKRDGQTSILHQGETAVIEAGVWHDWWNAGEGDARVRVEITPGERFVHMIETFFGLARLGRTDARGMPNPLQLALCTGVQRRDCVPFAAPCGVACDLWRTRTDRSLARLSRDIPAALAHRTGTSVVDQVVRAHVVLDQENSRNENLAVPKQWNRK